MFSNKHLDAVRAALCDELGPEDGVDPRILARKSEKSRSSSIRDLRLCGQVARLLSLEVDGALPAYVDRVEPAPDAGRLRVFVRLVDASVDPAAILATLTADRARLRAIVAAGIRRRRAPELVFDVLPGEAP